MAEERHGNCARIHDQHMLQAQCRELRRRNDFVDRMPCFSHFTPLLY
jgi:hypothetical protein